MRITHDPKAEITQWELEVLPNIDINIKHGNSLISRFAIDDTAKISLGDAKIIPLYKKAVRKYKSATDKAEKAKIVTEIDNYIKLLKKKIADTSVKHLELIETKLKLDTLLNQTDLFAASKSKKEEKELAKQIEILNKKIATLQIEVEDIEKNPIYAHAFEWRFEFPELLNDDGDFVGFDVVIGNPPYIQLQKDGGALANQLEGMHYATFERSGDIYSLFYEKGNQILINNGLLAFITSNKWMRAGYGEKTRQYFADKTNPKLLIDFAGAKIFESATVDTNIMLFQKQENQFQTQTCSVGSEYNPQIDLSDYINKNSGISKFADGSGWTIMNAIEAGIKAKIEAKGTALKDWDIKIYRGILTGYNEAFIIDGEKKKQLIEADPKSAEIIKPILRGRDIKRYKAEFAELWLINSHNGYKKNDGTKVERIDIDNYPAVKTHLDNYINALQKRQDKGETPYNLRNCAYVDEFEKEKIVYPETTQNNNFIYDKGQYYIDKTGFILISEDIKYILSILNSKLFGKIYRKYYSSIELGLTGYQFNKFAFEKFPIPIINEQEPFIKLVDIILTKKENGENTDEEEKQIDMMVYNLYGLTEEEIEIIEGR